jgi:glycosyltransferase involved in cell wall biosynthesis
VYPAPRPRAETLAALGLDPARRTLVGAGLVRGYKGYADAVEAVRVLGPDYQLVIAGPAYAEEPDVVEDLKRRAEGMPNVRLVLRRLTDAELADLHEAADCVLLAYRRITGSAALTTAQTLGRAVVATDLPYFRAELTTEPAAGVLVKPGDLHALTAGIRTFFDADVAARHAASRRIADRRAWSEVVRPVAERLRALCPGSRQ